MTITKAQLDYSRSLMVETNSILAGLDSTKRLIHDAVNWDHLGCTAVEKVKIFSGNATTVGREWRVLIEDASPAKKPRSVMVGWGRSGLSRTKQCAPFDRRCGCQSRANTSFVAFLGQGSKRLCGRFRIALSSAGRRQG